MSNVNLLSFNIQTKHVSHIKHATVKDMSQVIFLQFRNSISRINEHLSVRVYIVSSWCQNMSYSLTKHSHPVAQNFIPTQNGHFRKWHETHETWMLHNFHWSQECILFHSYCIISSNKENLIILFHLLINRHIH